MGNRFQRDAAMYRACLSSLSESERSSFELTKAVIDVLCGESVQSSDKGDLTQQLDPSVVDRLYDRLQYVDGCVDVNNPLTSPLPYCVASYLYGKVGAAGLMTLSEQEAAEVE